MLQCHRDNMINYQGTVFSVQCSVLSTQCSVLSVHFFLCYRSHGQVADGHFGLKLFNLNNWRQRQ